MRDHDALWSLKKATVRQVWEGLPRTRDVERGTVQTMLRRLDHKGYVQHHLEGKAHVFTPAIEPQRVLLTIVRDLVQTYFKRESRLIIHLVENNPISYGDLKQIELMLAAPEAVRAKVGLEPLEGVGVEQTEKGWRLRFQGPQQARYQEGTQCVFVATVPKEHLTAAKTPWVLRSVRWLEGPAWQRRKLRTVSLADPGRRSTELCSMMRPASESGRLRKNF